MFLQQFSSVVQQVSLIPLSHTFEYEGNVTTSFNIYGADSFIIEKITNISSIVLYTDHSSIGSVEDVIIDRIEWD